jgi:hypothetical protein
VLLSFWHLGSFLGAQTLNRNGSVLVRQVKSTGLPGRLELSINRFFV